MDFCTDICTDICMDVRMDVQTDVRTYVRDFSPFYRTWSPVRAAAQKAKGYHGSVFLLAGQMVNSYRIH